MSEIDWFPIGGPSTDSLKVLEPTRDDADEYGYGFGAEVVVLRSEHIEALLSGKMLAWTDNEYVTFVVLDDD